MAVVNKLEKSQVELAEQVELSIIIPCLNERDNIKDLLVDLEAMRQSEGLSNFETIILDDNSSDGTFDEIVKNFSNFPLLNIRAIRRYDPSRGYGAIIRFGIAHARGEYVVPVSADGVDPIWLIPVFLKRAREGADLVQCSRYINERDADTIPFKYKFFQTIWRILLRVLLGEAVKDSTYSFRIFRRIDILALGLTANRFNISAEIFLKFLLSKANIQYVAFGQGVRQKGVSHFRFRREGIGYGYGLLRAWIHQYGIKWF
jgi:glycosyltransferase involved in cell wall biosynthesis